MTYYIFRHASTFASKYHIPYGSKIKTAEILPEGIPVIERLAKYLQNIESEANFSSPFLRCRQTAEIIEKITKKNFINDIRIGEYLEGIMAFSKFRARIKDFLDEIGKKHNGNILICTHGDVIAGVKHFLIKNSFHLWNISDYPKTGILTIIKDKKVSEVNFN